MLPRRDFQVRSKKTRDGTDFVEERDDDGVRRGPPLAAEVVEECPPRAVVGGNGERLGVLHEEASDGGRRQDVVDSEKSPANERCCISAVLQQDVGCLCIAVHECGEEERVAPHDVTF